MPHMTADDRLKAIRQAEGETIKATLAPNFKVHRTPDGLDRFGPAPKEDRRTCGPMGRALMMAAAQNRALAEEENTRIMSKHYNEMHGLRAPKEDKRTSGSMMSYAILMAGVAAWIAIGALAIAQAWLGGS